MDGFNINKIILGLQHVPEFFKRPKANGSQATATGFSPSLNNMSLAESNSQNKPFIQPFQQNTANVQNNLQMNALANNDRSVYIKNLLGLPQNLSDLFKQIQNPEKPISPSTLILNGINEDMVRNRKVLADIFDEQTALANLSDEIANINSSIGGKAQKDTVALFFSCMINLQDISKLITQNGKQAVAALIIAMASASKNGMNNEQIRETLSIINSCVSMAESNTPTQTLKSLMLLYLPWLPLNEDVGFDLEVTPQSGENDSNDSKLTVLIQTKNFGNIKGDFTLTTTNSVDILITCTENFPKKILEQSLSEESSAHAMNTNIDIEEVAPKVEEIKANHETKVNLSATNEMNPYLLLMAHAFIRNTILIDNNATVCL